MNQTVIMVFYAILVLVFAFLGYRFMNRVVNVTANVGAVLGGVAGVILSVALWFAVGQKMVGQSSEGAVELYGGYSATSPDF